MAVRRPHTDAPDTAAAFVRLVAAPAGRERELLVEELVTAWLPMAHRIAVKFKDRGENLEDLQQVAAMGLVKAIERYDPAQGAFEAYAVPTITGEIRRHFRDHGWDVRVPRRVQELRNKVRVARRDILDQPGRTREPALEEIAAGAQLTLEEVRAGMEALDSYRALSLDAATASGQEQGDAFSLADTLGGEEAAYDRIDAREAAKAGLRALPERERHILYLRYFEDMTQARIAEKIGVSQMQISRLINHSCARVRDRAAA